MFWYAYDPEMTRLFLESDNTPEDLEPEFAHACAVMAVLLVLGVSALVLAWP